MSLSSIYSGSGSSTDILSLVGQVTPANNVSSTPSVDAYVPLDPTSTDPNANPYATLSTDSGTGNDPTTFDYSTINGTQTQGASAVDFSNQPTSSSPSLATDMSTGQTLSAGEQIQLSALQAQSGLDASLVSSNINITA